MRSPLAPCLAAVLVTTVLSGAPPANGRVAPASEVFPSRIELPDGFQPEGIAIGPGPTAWFGSRADGDIFEVSLRTGEGALVSQGPGTPSVGLKSDRQGRLWVAGGPSGTARVVDTDTGAITADIPLTPSPTFVNDVVLTKRAAWFTDSFRAQLYRVGRDAGGAPAGSVTTLPLSGAWVQGAGFGANGITTTPTGGDLLVVHSTSGLLHRVDSATGVTSIVDLGGATLTMGDGMLRHGRTLYVVRNRIDEIAVVRLDRRGTSGRLVRTITAADLDDATSFDTPTTVARFGAHLYLPNARFRTTPEPTSSTDYWVTKVRARPGR